MKKYLALILILLFLFSCTTTLEAAKKSPWRPAKKTVKKKVVKKKTVIIKKAKKPVKKTVVKSTTVKTVEKVIVVEEKPTLPPSTAKPALKPTQPAAPAQKMKLSPKIQVGTGMGTTFGLGAEFAFPIMPKVDGMAEVIYVPGSGYTVIALAGNGVYYFDPVPGMPVNFYAGGGVLYDIISISTWAGASGSASAIGFQGFGGCDIPVAGMGVFFAQMKYAFASFSYNAGFGISATANAGGFLMEGGYRFTF
jgi:hypothetical protein